MMYRVYSIMFIVSLTTSLFAQIPRTLSYQGVLTDGSGNTKPDGNYNISFSLYEQSTGGTAIWTEAKQFALTKGLFSTTLGDQTPFGDSIKFNKQYWLGISVGTDPELTPRIVLNANGYSFSSIYSDTASNIIDKKVVKGINGLKDNITIQGGGGTTINSNGNIITVTSSGTGGTGIQGIQNTNNTFDISNSNGPTATVNLKNPLSLTGSVNSPNSIITGTAAGTGFGIFGISDLGSGVVGIATGTTNSNAGVGGNSETPTGFAVSGWNLASTGDAVGVIGRTNSPAGIGVLGSVGSIGTGIRGISNSGRGVWGSSSSYQGVYGFSQSQAGVVGESNGFDGIYGVSNTNNFAGVSGHNDNGGFGVWGGTSTGTGVFGVFTYGIGVKGTGGTFAVLGQNSNSGNIFGALGYHGPNPSGFNENGILGYTDNVKGAAIIGWAAEGSGAWAGIFEGPSEVVGDFFVTNGTKYFKIDHPLDPENKFLFHSCIESPDRMNIYNGNITTDAGGLATVNLPSYFEDLNIDFRYQLSVIGQFAQVIVEKEKNEMEKGKYYFPYGQPKSKSQFNSDIKSVKIS